MEAETSELAAEVRSGPPAPLPWGVVRPEGGWRFQGRFATSGRLTGTCPKAKVPNRARPQPTIPTHVPINDISSQPMRQLPLGQLVTYLINLSTVWGMLGVVILA